MEQRRKKENQARGRRSEAAVPYAADTRDASAVRRHNRMLRAVAHRKQARTLLTLFFGIAAALVITAILAVPHASAEPVEVTAPVEQATPVPEEPASDPVSFSADYEQLADWELVLVNDVVPLPEDFVMTPRLYDTVQVNAKIYTALCELLDDARADGVTLWVASGYRSVEEQETILENAVQSRMRDGLTREDAYENARLTIQAPKHSEHHTGLAVDFNNVAQDFEETDAYAWLQAHAAEYGFVERYPEDKEDITGIHYEPWHYRYVGRTHAEAMQSLGMCLEEYVLYLKGQM